MGAINIRPGRFSCLAVLSPFPHRSRAASGGASARLRASRRGRRSPPCVRRRGASAVFPPSTRSATSRSGSHANGAAAADQPVGLSARDAAARLTTPRLVSPARSAPTAQYLAALGWNDFQGDLTIINLTTDAKSHRPARSTAPGDADHDEDCTVGPDGPLWSPDGNTIWVPQIGYLHKFTFDPAPADRQTDAILLCGRRPPILPAPATPPYDRSRCGRHGYLPSGMALSPDGSKLYVALNGANALGVIDTATDTLSDRSRSATRRARSCSPTARPPTSPTRVAVRRSPADFTNLSDGTPIVVQRVDRRGDHRHRVGRRT